MRHKCRVAQLGLPADQRKALLRTLTTELLRHGQIKITKTRAQAVRQEAERSRLSDRPKDDCGTDCQADHKGQG